MRGKTYLFTLILLLCSALRCWGAEIPAEYIGTGKWVTLKTVNGYYFHAIEEGGQVKLGHTQTAPTKDNYAGYCWQIEGDATEGYTFRCLKYEEDARGKMYITNPEKLSTAYQEVRLTTTPSKYLYTDNHQLQLVDNKDLYLAFYSSSWHTVRLHNSADYVGSKMIIGGIYDWSVEAIVYGTEGQDDQGRDQTQYVPDGGIRVGNVNHTHGDSFYTDDLTSYSAISVTNYSHKNTVKDEASHTIKVYYNYWPTTNTKKEAEAPDVDAPAIIGDYGVVWSLDPKNYITNTSGNYTYVPAGKVWRMEMVVHNTNESGNDPSFNQWGSTILASGNDAFNNKYINEFQVYQHAPTHKSPNTLNFKSNKDDGLDHIIAQGASVANRNYKVIVTYNGDKTYIIRTIMLDAKLQETNEVYNNVWVATRQQNEIHQLSCALPNGINLQSLRISIAEESNLLEDMDYAIQNIGNEHYLNGTGTVNDARSADWHSVYAGDAVKCQIEWTGIEELTYSEDDGGLHHSFYIKVGDKWIDKDNNLVSDNTQAQAFVYTTVKQVHPITDTNQIDEAWKIGNNETWLFDFFATFYVEVVGNSEGGLKYHRNGEVKTAKNGEYIDLPSGVKVSQLANSSQLGYSAEITKSDIRLKVQYTPLEDTFYTFAEKKADGQETLYYWYKPQKKLVSYSTKNTESGQDVTSSWGEMGDCSLWSIVKATDIPFKLNQNTLGSDADNRWYGTLYFPNAVVIPSGVEAYTVSGTGMDAEGQDYYTLQAIEGGVVPHHTAAILRSNENVSSLTLSNRNDESISGLLKGELIDKENPCNKQQASSYIYVLSGIEGVGFYPYDDDMIPAFRAYYETNKQTAKFRFSLDDEESSITSPSIDDEQLNAQSVIYNLMGQPVSEPTPGHIYIINGKRIFIK